MQIVFSIFILPYEIDELDRIFMTLLSELPSHDNCSSIAFDVSVCVSDTIVDWDGSHLPKQFFLDHILRMNSLYQSIKIRVSPTNDLHGCVSCRYSCIKNYPDCDYFVWLDPDIIFKPGIIKSILSAIEIAQHKSPYTILTPEFVRIWDTTWDCLVNSEFLDKPFDYQKTNNPFIDCGVKGKLTLQEVHNTSEGQPRFKFAGGWFTCLSGKLLRLIGIPDSFSPYGLEDTFIMWVAEHLVRSGKIDIRQYKIKNLVVCENYKYRDYSHYTNHMAIIDRREEYLSQTRRVFNTEVQNTVNRILRDF